MRLVAPAPGGFGVTAEGAVVRVGRVLRRAVVQEAAVAVVLHGRSAADAQVLLVRRSLKAGDPWSGHMALPGGRRAAGDSDLLATALRETHEEVGLTLARTQVLGALPPVFTVAPARQALVFGAMPMLVRPYVLMVDGPVQCALSAEVSAVRWVSLQALRDPARRTTRPWRFLGVRWPAPAWDLDGDIVWGLTYQMLTTLVRSLR